MLEKWFGRASADAVAVANESNESARALVWQRAASPRGMIQFGSITYRIVRLSANRYGVVRLIDDRYMGCFEQQPALRVFAEVAQDGELVAAIAKSAIRTGRTTWAGRASPTPVG